jgi:hypothetical protein
MGVLGLKFIFCNYDAANHYRTEEFKVIDHSTPYSSFINYSEDDSDALGNVGSMPFMSAIICP